MDFTFSSSAANGASYGMCPSSKALPEKEVSYSCLSLSGWGEEKCVFPNSLMSLWDALVPELGLGLDLRSSVPRLPPSSLKMELLKFSDRSVEDDSSLTLRGESRGRGIMSSALFDRSR